MKKISLLLCTLVILFTFCACNKPTVYFDGKYDEDKYTPETVFSGTSILIPKSLYDAKEPQADASKYETKELPKHVFEAKTDADYMLYEPGLFILYVFDLGKADGMTEKQDLGNLSAKLGTSKWLAFSERNPDTYTSINIDGNVQSVYSAYIVENTTGSEANYSGYVTILHNADTENDYCMFVGFADEKYDVAAQTVANSFLLTK